MIQLISLNINRATEYFELCKEYARYDGSKYAKIDTIEKARTRIESDIKLAGSEIPKNKVRTLVRWVENNKHELVGTCRIRLELLGDFALTGGHIGYDVRPKNRKNGIGTEILRLALIEIRNNGIQNILVTCNDDNIGSSKIIERNGGILENKIWDEDEGKEVRRYWIYK
jgi:predicted acetyltransferase